MCAGRACPGVGGREGPNNNNVTGPRWGRSVPSGSRWFVSQGTIAGKAAVTKRETRLGKAGGTAGKWEQVNAAASREGRKPTKGNRVHRTAARKYRYKAGHAHHGNNGRIKNANRSRQNSNRG